MALDIIVSNCMWLCLYGVLLFEQDMLGWTEGLFVHTVINDGECLIFVYLLHAECQASTCTVMLHTISDACMCGILSFQHGRMMCERQNVCPQLTCPKIDQLQIPGECCPVCKGKLSFIMSTQEPWFDSMRCTMSRSCQCKLEQQWGRLFWQYLKVKHMVFSSLQHHNSNLGNVYESNFSITFHIIICVHSLIVKTTLT